MNIALLGYGRMGKTIAQLAKAGQHEIIYKTDEKADVKQLQKADVAIDFSVPEAAFDNITTCLKHGVPVVTGTTGWLEKYDEAVKICKEENGSFLFASNFSVGMNLFFALNNTLAKMMRNLNDYKLSIEEIHHTKKLDKPSGTAITLAENIIEQSSKENWKLLEDDNAQNTSDEAYIPITAKRLKDVKGTHTVKYSSDIDTIEIEHKAFSREGFAQGAILAAQYIHDKKGVFTMKEVLQDLI